MEINKQVINHVAALAQLDLPPEVLGDLQTNLQEILDLVDHLQQVDTSGIEPLANPLDAVQRLRPDEITEADQRDRYLAGAPESEKGLFLVPKVIE